MPSLSDRLKALGVQVGASGLPKTQRANHPIEKILEGRTINFVQGEVFLVEQQYPFGHPHGNANLALTAPMEIMAEWAGDARIKDIQPEKFVFIDTETTGLSGGSGTLAFMIGLGRFEQDDFKLTQFFLRDPSEEPAMLSALEQYLAPCRALVSFNGKAFDIPLIQARYIANSQPQIFQNITHIDLLHLARRLWRERLPSRALNYLEQNILDHQRAEEDTPGSIIPQLYFDYLRCGDARPLKGVFYHNAMDILSMVTLMERMALMLAEPLGSQVEHALDLVALGKLHEDLGYWNMAAKIYTCSLEQELPDKTRHQTIKRLSYLQKRRGELPEALSLWWQAAAERQVYAHEELAKYYEHQARDYIEAKRWTEAALVLIKMPDSPHYERVKWQQDFEYRLARLERRLNQRLKGK